MSLNSMRQTMHHSAKWILGAVTVAMVVTTFSWNASSFFGAHNSSAAAAPSGDDTVATVNGDPITRQDYENARAARVSQIQQMGQSPVPIDQIPQLNNTALEQLIYVKLQVQLAKQLHISVSDDEIRKEREDIVNRLGLRQTLSLPATASLDDINTEMVKNGGQPLNERFSDDALRPLILIGDPQLGIPGKINTTLAAADPVREADARQYYTQYHTRHILIDNKSKSDVQAKSLALQILAKAKAPGADFAALAKQYSDDPGTKARGGDDGFIDQSTGYVPEFKKAAFSLQPGQVTPDPVVSPQYGYFIIKLDGTKSNLPPDFDKNPAKYIAQVQQERTQQKSYEMLTALKDSAKITVSDPALAGDRAFTTASGSGNPALSQQLYKEAQADYQKALQGNLSIMDKGSVNASLAAVDMALHQTPQAIAAYEAAVQAHDDASLRMTLGKLYLQNKDNTNALQNFQQASQLAWNDEGIHQNLLMDFRQLGHPELAAKEASWLQAYAKQHPAPTGLQGSVSNGMLPPSPATARPAGVIHVGPSVPKAKPTQ